MRFSQFLHHGCHGFHFLKTSWNCKNHHYIKRLKLPLLKHFYKSKNLNPIFFFKIRNNFLDNAIPFLEWVSNVLKNSNPSELSKLDQYIWFEHFLKLYFYYCTIVFSEKIYSTIFLFLVSFHVQYVSNGWADSIIKALLITLYKVTRYKLQVTCMYPWKWNHNKYVIQRLEKFRI